MRTLFALLVTVLLFISCSGPSDQDLYNSAKAAIENEKYDDAMADFKTLVKDFPQSKYMTESLLELGKLYHGKVAKNISETESLEKAIQYYRMVVEREPNNEAAPNALFMIGFLQANELNQLDSAKVTYNLFLEKYPESELAFSAKAELESLGISPEEILKKAAEEK